MKWQQAMMVKVFGGALLVVSLLPRVGHGATTGPSPAELVRQLPADRTYSPATRAVEAQIVQLGEPALPALEQELRLGITFPELNRLLQTNGSRRAAVVGVLARMPGAKATELLVRSLADPPDSYGMRFATLQALTNRTLTPGQIVTLMQNQHPEVALAGIAQATRGPVSADARAALEKLFDPPLAREQFKNEYGAATANMELLWEVRLAAGSALQRDMRPEIRAKATEILADLEKHSTNPTRLDEPARLSNLAQAEAEISRGLNRLAGFGAPVKDLVEQAAGSAKGNYAAVLDMALARLGDQPRVAKVAGHLTDSPSPMIRICAAMTLRLCNDRSAIPALKRAMNDPYQRRSGSDVGPADRLVYPVRMIAADALADFGEQPKRP